MYKRTRMHRARHTHFAHSVITPERSTPASPTEHYFRHWSHLGSSSTGDEMSVPQPQNMEELGKQISRPTHFAHANALVAPISTPRLPQRKCSPCWWLLTPRRSSRLRPSSRYGLPTRITFPQTARIPRTCRLTAAKYRYALALTPALRSSGFYEEARVRTATDDPDQQLDRNRGPADGRRVATEEDWCALQKAACRPADASQKRASFPSSDALRTTSHRTHKVPS